MKDRDVSSNKSISYLQVVVCCVRDFSDVEMTGRTVADGMSESGFIGLKDG